MINNTDITIFKHIPMLRTNDEPNSILLQDLVDKFLSPGYGMGNIVVKTFYRFGLGMSVAVRPCMGF